MKPLQALLALFACAFLPLHAAGLDDLTYTTTDGKVTITGCDEAAAGELIIPNTIDGNPVIYIGQSAFERTRLTRVTVPEGVIDIGSYAFLDLTSLVEITLPQSLIRIGNNAFTNCRNLRDFPLPPNLFSISRDAFSYCHSLEHITVPDSVIIVEQSAFEACFNLKKIKFGSNVLNIAEEVCSLCRSLETVTLGNPRAISRNAFFGCKKLTEISIPASVTEIDAYAFNSAGLQKVNIPDGLITIQIYAFLNCSSLKRIIIPASVTSIDGRAFSGCYDLHSLIFLGPAPNLSFQFRSMTTGATAYIQSEHQDSFGGANWESLGLPIKIGNGPSTPPVRIHFPTVEGVTYGMQNSIDLVNWRTEPFPIMGDANNRYDRFVDPSSGPKIFYRLKKVD